MRRTKLLISKGIVYTMTGAMMLSGGMFVSQAGAAGVETVYAAEQSTEAKAEEGEYILMNIPYDAFYEEELQGNDVKVDAVTSATKTKPRTGSLVGGSYHEKSDGTDISGVTFPVKLGEGVTLEDLKAYKEVTEDDSISITATNRGQTVTTEYKGKEALFESGNFAYYKLKETPSYYKTVTKDASGLHFGKTEGKSATTLSNASATLATKSSYGDYQIAVSGLPSEVNTVYGVILETRDGVKYGLRHLENIWLKTNLAWSVGFTTSSHGSPLRSAHYESMMGKTIKRITYLTDTGVYKIPVKLYVPNKFDESQASVQISDINLSVGTATFSVSGLPEDYEPVYAVEGISGASITDGKITLPKETTPGSYTFTISDANKTYADVSASFKAYTTKTPAVYDSVAKALEVADGVSTEELSNYIKNITAVSVDGKSYAASGRGATKLINEDGTLVADASPFKNGDSFSVTVKATGYQNDLTFTYTKAEETSYVLMNIPYEKFYASEMSKNNGKIDAVTSATKTKPRTGGLVGGSYHKDSTGDSILGVTFPVKLGDGVTLDDLKAYRKITDSDSVSITVTNRGRTTTTEYKGQDAIFESGDYSYYLMKKTPSYYKVVTKAADGSLTFGKVQGKTSTLRNVSAVLQTTSRYGDYQMSVKGLPADVNTVYGVILGTTDGSTYALRHLENIWQKTNFAWSVGYTTSSHGSPLSFEHYKSIMGKTINKITYITSEGLYKMPVNVYVPVKFNGYNEASVAVGDIDDVTREGSYTVTGLPDDFEPEYKIVNVENAQISDGKIQLPDDIAVGTYTFVVSDKSEDYAEVTGTFKVYASPAKKDFSSSACKVVVDGVEQKDYTGKPVTLSKLTVAVSGQTLKEDVDYTVSYTDNKNIGTATVTITGKGDYTGSVSKIFKIAAKAGKSFTVDKVNYKIVNDSSVQVTSASGKTTRTSLMIPATVKIGGQSFKVTAIAKNAFKGFTKLQKVTIGENVTVINESAFQNCKKLNAITVKGSNIQSVKAKAFSGIKAKATVKVPAKKKAEYKKLFTKAGLPKNAKIK